MVPLAVPCNLCEYLAAQLLDSLHANSTIGEVEKFLHGLCQALPGSVKSKVRRFQRTYSL